MRHGLSSLVALLALAAAGTAGARAQAPAAGASVEDTIRSLELRRAEAILSADTVALSRLVADDFVEISRLGTVRPRAANLREIASGALRLSAIRYDSLTVSVYGDVAVLMGVVENAGTLQGMPFSGRLRYTRVFVRGEGGWKAVAMQQTVVAAP